MPIDLHQDGNQPADHDPARCDLCHAPIAGTTWLRLGARSFVHDVRVTPVRTSRIVYPTDGWASCPDCWPLLAAGDYERLARRRTLVWRANQIPVSPNDPPGWLALWRDIHSHLTGHVDIHDRP